MKNFISKSFGESQGSIKFKLQVVCGQTSVKIQASHPAEPTGYPECNYYQSGIP